MLLYVGSAIASLVFVAEYLPSAVRRIAGHAATLDPKRVPPSWQWNHGRAFHAFRLGNFTMFWCAAICLLTLRRLAPGLAGLVAALRGGEEVSAQAACTLAVTAAPLAVCVIVVVHAAVLANVERAAYWLVLNFVLMAVAGLVDLDGTELDVIHTTYEHMSILTGMAMTMIPVDFELTIPKASSRAAVLAVIAAHFAVLCLYGLPHILFCTVLLCVGVRCMSLRFDALELDVMQRKTMPNELIDTLAEIGEIRREASKSPGHQVSGVLASPLSQAAMRWKRARSGSTLLSTPSPVCWGVPSMTMGTPQESQADRPTGSRNGIRILSIDGGGSKGVGAFKTLEMLEAAAGKPLHELYDFFIGSSIGGAVLVGKLVSGYDFDRFYAKLVPAMARFGRGQSVLRLLWTGSAQTVEETMVFLRACFEDEDAMRRTFYGASAGKRLVPIAITTSRNNADGSCETHLVCNYDEPDDPWEVGDVVRATTSFPTVCPPFEKNGQVYLDGGLLANNPLLEGFREATALYAGRPVAFLHSIGMGGASEAEANGTAPDTSSLGPLLGSQAVNNVKRILSTVAETSAGLRHVRGLLGILHPEAALRRVDLPLSHHGVFPPNEAEYAEIAQETVHFLGTSEVYRDMIDDHVGYISPSGA